jgi:hypothetical protein
MSDKSDKSDFMGAPQVKNLPCPGQSFVFFSCQLAFAGVYYPMAIYLKGQRGIHG